MKLTDRNILYIGGFGGIGRECIEECLRRSVRNIIICDIKEDIEQFNCWQRIFKSSIFYIPIDMEQQDSIEKAYQMAYKQIGYIDIVINGCGLMDERCIDSMININLKGVIHSSLCALRYMDESKGGRGGTIVNIGSVAGLVPSGMFAVYSATKYAIIGFTCSMANRSYYDKTGVNFITVCPGLTETNLLNDIGKKITLTEYGQSMVELFDNMKRQTAKDCAKNLLDALEIDKFGAVWLLDLGQLEEILMPKLWHYTSNK